MNQKRNNNFSNLKNIFNLAINVLLIIIRMDQKRNNYSNHFRNLFNLAIIFALFFFFPRLEKPLVEFAET